MPDCGKTFRSDKFKLLFENYSDLKILEEARKLNNITLGTEHIKGLILDASKRNHTVFLLQQGYSTEKLPNS